MEAKINKQEEEYQQKLQLKDKELADLKAEHKNKVEKLNEVHQGVVKEKETVIQKKDNEIAEVRLMNEKLS